MVASRDNEVDITDEEKEIIAAQGVDDKAKHVLPMLVVSILENELDLGSPSTGIDKDYNVFIWYHKLSRMKGKKDLLIDVSGRGPTYRDACIDFLNQLLDDNYKLKVDGKGYSTKKIREIITKTCMYDPEDFKS